MAASRDFAVVYVNGLRHLVRGSMVWMMAADWLRRELGLVGTKIVCAEGDCGACTVLRATPVKGIDAAPQFVPMNACIATVAHLDGSSLVTVEGVALDDQPSPVQSAMQKCHGSQCGYCTPGFVMAMSGLFEKCDRVDARRAANYLTGNLCRCTGYAPILEAATTVVQQPAFRVQERYLSKEILDDLRVHQKIPLRVDDESREYFAPTKIAVATKFLAANPTARVLGAATDLGVQINKGKAWGQKLLSLRAIPNLHQIKFSQGRFIVGANVSLAELRRACSSKLPEFADFLNVFASPQIKNVATLIGNVANGSPIGDTLPFLLVMNAQVHVRSWKGSKEVSRTIDFHQFFRGYKQLAMEPSELVTHMSFNVTTKSQRLVLLKASQRKDLDISAVSAAFLIENGVRDEISMARVAYGGVAATPVRLSMVEDYLVGKSLDQIDPDSVKTIVYESIQPISDVRASADYRRLLSFHLFMKWIERLTLNHETSIKAYRNLSRTLPLGEDHA